MSKPHLIDYQQNEFWNVTWIRLPESRVVITG